MNSLALRISNAGGKKSKTSNNFMKLDASQYFPQELLETNEAFMTFYGATSADEQLAALKPILEKEATTHGAKGECNTHSIQFLVKLLFNAEAKHPVKCFLMRHITKNTFFHRQFSEALSEEIKSCISIKPPLYREYTAVLTKISSCIENFPTGVAAVKIIELDVARYLDECLQCCVEALRSTQISPTEKNAIYNLAHLTLRLFLNIVQKVSPENRQDVTSMFNTVRLSIRELWLDGDTPMDTKSVCGMVYLNMHISENGPDSWTHILQSSPPDYITTLLLNESSQISLYSAVATVVPLQKLQSQIVDNESALLVLCNKFLAVGERNSSESVFILGVTRSLVQITKNIGKVTDKCVGLPLVANLLNFVWAHLEHYMDSVRHLAAQILGNIVNYCSKLDAEGDPEALNALFEALTTFLDHNRKSYYVCLTSLVAALGADEVLRRLPSCVRDVISATSVLHVRASATTALETLLQNHIQEADTLTIYSEWVEPILYHVDMNELDFSGLAVLDHLLTRAVQRDKQLIHHILPHIKQSKKNLQCMLMLLSVARKSGVTVSTLPADEGQGWNGRIGFNVLDLPARKPVTESLDQTPGATSKLPVDEDQQWRGLIGYEVLEKAAINSVEETRILSLSLIVESPKTSEVFSRGELYFIVKFLKYNINVQSPNFRQLMLSMFKKLIKRLEDSHRVLKKRKDLSEDYYVTFLEELRSVCLWSLIPGANYSRRVVALQVLLWSEQAHLDGSDKVWTEEYVEKLLQRLEDSYENNKAFALEILNACPTRLIASKKYSISLDLVDILRQASSLKPTDCVSAAYKLQLLTTKLPERIVPDSASNANVAARISFTLLQILLAELERSNHSLAEAVVNAPMYGMLYCMRHVLTRIDPHEISSDAEWSALTSSIIARCLRVTELVSCVVNNSSPEGHLPMDMGGVSDHGNMGGLRLEDGRQVTAQMVLLCAWRSVKEVSLLLGEISSRFVIVGEDSAAGNLTAEQLVSIGEHFTKLLAETKHRGAFEQAYVGFTMLLSRLWRCKSATLHSLPAAWLRDLLSAVAGAGAGAGAGGGRALCVTRRGAGLPFMIQALVTTELQVQSNPKCFHHCMTTLLRLARPPSTTEQQSETNIESRTHALNILRALFRNSTLDESVAGYVGEGLKVALEGFEGGSWMERNSSTLLFSALMVRVFGVTRSKDTDNLCVRNRMTGRIFFLRYPQLYDFMLEKLKEVNSTDNSQLLRPSLYPILLLLARLYPSSLEGTVSNLKLSAYIPLVSASAHSRLLRARQLAATAMLPLIPPEHYLQHFETLLGLLGDRNIKMNYCHGILLQLTRLLSASKPSSPDSTHGALEAALLAVGVGPRVTAALTTARWLLSRAPPPCYTVLNEYISMINLVVWRFPTLIDKNESECIQMYLERLIFSENTSSVNSGRDICLSNALYLYYILIIRRTDIIKIYDLMYKTVSHQSYEVVLTTLNFFLILYESLEIENLFQEHLDHILNKRGQTLQIAKQLHEYTHLLCEVLRRNRYFECQQKALKILSLQKNTEKYIVQTKMKKKGVRLTDDMVINTLIDCIYMEHENLVPIYLTCLSNYITRIKFYKHITSVLDGNKEAVIKPNLMLNTLRVMLACSRADSSEECRSVVVGFVESILEEIFMMGLNGLSKEAKFEFKATIYAILVTLLEDYDETIRQRASNIVIKLQDIFPNASKAFRSTQFLNVDEAVFRSPNDLNDFRKASHLQISDHRSRSQYESASSNTNEAFSGVVPSKSGEILRELIARNEEQNFPILFVLAMLDFKTEVVMNDEVNDECRVFDQNERYNIYLEETVWTKEIAQQMINIFQQKNVSVLDWISFYILDNKVLRRPIEKLCNYNLVLLEKLLTNGQYDDETQVNPKVDVFVSTLKKQILS